MSTSFSTRGGDVAMNISMRKSRAGATPSALEELFTPEEDGASDLNSSLGRKGSMAAASSPYKAAPTSSRRSSVARLEEEDYASANSQASDSLRSSNGMFNDSIKSGNFPSTYGNAVFESPAGAAATQAPASPLRVKRNNLFDSSPVQTADTDKGRSQGGGDQRADDMAASSPRNLRKGFSGVLSQSAGGAGNASPRSGLQAAASVGTPRTPNGRSTLDSDDLSSGGTPASPSFGFRQPPNSATRRANNILSNSTGGMSGANSPAGGGVGRGVFSNGGMDDEGGRGQSPLAGRRNSAMATASSAGGFGGHSGLSGSLLSPSMIRTRSALTVLSGEALGGQQEDDVSSPMGGYAGTPQGTATPKRKGPKQLALEETAAVRSQSDGITAVVNFDHHSPSPTLSPTSPAEGAQKQPHRGVAALPDGGWQGDEIEDDFSETAEVPRSVRCSSYEWGAQLREQVDGRTSNSSATAAAFLRPGPEGGLVRCYVRRSKNFFGGHSSYALHLADSDTFLLAARKRKKTKTSSFVISQDLEDLKRDTDNCLAKLKANFVGTEYTLWGRSDDKNERKGYGHEMLGLCYKQTSITTPGGPRVMHVAVASPGGAKKGDSTWRPAAPDGSDALLRCLDRAHRRELGPVLEKQLGMFTTRQPDYNEATKAHTLDFGGRVKEASVKNFQLVSWDHSRTRRANAGPVTTTLQFGKVADDTYILDFGFPLNIQSAFAIALASFDSKLCYAL